MGNDVFSSLSDGDKTLLYGGVHQRSYQRGDFLFHEGDEQHDLYVLRVGHVRVERQYRGQGIAVARYGPEDVLGEVSFLGGQKALGSVVADEDVKVDVLEGRRLRDLLGANAEFARNFYRALAVCLGERLVQILPGIQLPDALRGGPGARSSILRTGQLSARQVPSEVARGVKDFHTAMHGAAADLIEKRSDPDAARRRVNESCDAIADLLNRFTTDEVLIEIGMTDLMAFRDVPNLARGLGGYVFRETFPFFMQSATIAQGYERSRGFAEGREWLQRVEDNRIEGDGILGPLIDRWFLGRPICRARRDSVVRTTTLLREWTAGSAGAGPVRITSLSAGPAGEIFGLLTDAPQALYATCIDSDADAVAADTARARELHRADRVTFLQADLPDLIAGRGSVSLGEQQVIYGLGVCDYLNDADVIHLLDWVHGLLADGGRVLLTNRDAASPDRAFTEHILDWPVVHRTADEFRRLFDNDKSPFKGLPVEITPEEAGVNLFAHCRKNA